MHLDQPFHLQQRHDVTPSHLLLSARKRFAEKAIR
jgi:hypothetical protein